jgi:hypothetical protein
MTDSFWVTSQIPAEGKKIHNIFIMHDDSKQEEPDDRNTNYSEN